jgi:hypothetical protein
MSAQEIAVEQDEAGGIGRRSFVGYVIGGTTLVAAADLALGTDRALGAPAATAAGRPPT